MCIVKRVKYLRDHFFTREFAPVDYLYALGPLLAWSSVKMTLTANEHKFSHKIRARYQPRFVIGLYKLCFIGIRSKAP